MAWIAVVPPSRSRERYQVCYREAPASAQPAFPNQARALAGKRAIERSPPAWPSRRLRPRERGCNLPSVVGGVVAMTSHIETTGRDAMLAEDAASIRMVVGEGFPGRWGCQDWTTARRSPWRPPARTRRSRVGC